MRTNIAECLQRISARPSNSKKYDYGHLVIIGGSKHYSGAVALNALAAGITGVDLITVCAPQRAADALLCMHPDIISYPLKGNHISARHFNEINNVLRRKATAVLVGSGLGRNAGSFNLIRKLRERNSIPFLFDADALYGLAGIKLNDFDVLIPNLKEFAMLSSNAKRSEHSVKSLSRRFGCIVLSKGMVDYASDGRSVQRITGLTKRSAYLAKAGTGDLLAGVCGSLIAQGINSYDACVCAARIIKDAGEMIAKSLGPFYTAVDVLPFIRDVLANSVKRMRAKSKTI